MSNVIEEIAAERQRQIEKEGYTHRRDDRHIEGELATAAAVYASPNRLYEKEDFAASVSFRDPWPWDNSGNRPYDGNVPLDNNTLGRKARRKQLVMAAALIVAEIERLDRTQPQGAPDGQQ